jgi:hypothetical protein
MKVLCRAYDVEAPGASGAAMRALAGALRARGDAVWATAAAVELAAVEAWAPDVIVAQQWATWEAAGWSASLHRPFVMLVHGCCQYEHFAPTCDLVVFTTVALADAARDAIGRTPFAIADLAVDAAGVCERLAGIAAAGRRRPTLTLGMTVANEAATLEQAIDSVAGVVDEIVIGVDATSTDDTLEIARRRATRTFVFDESRPPDFPRMRNRAMALVETDWVVVLDGHEWIEHADRIRDAMQTAAWSIEIQTLFEPDEQRVPALAFPFPRIHRRHVRFTGAAAHEEVSTPMARRTTRLDIHVWHERKPGAAAAARCADKSGAELQRLREAWHARGDRRALFYLANGLRERGDHDAAAEAYREYLRAPNFADEGWQARLYLARCEGARGAWAAAEQEYQALVAAAPERAEALVGLGHALLARGDARRAAAWFRMATALPTPHDCRMFIEVPVYRWGGWHGLALALHALGDAAGAADAETRAAANGAGDWARQNVAWWRERAGTGGMTLACAGGDR